MTTPGSIYPVLQRIAHRKWIKPIVDRNSSRRRIVYCLTARSSGQLKGWLSQAVDEEQVAYKLDEVMLRLSFHHLLRDQARLDVLLAALGRAAHAILQGSSSSFVFPLQVIRGALRWLSVSDS